MVGRKMQNEYIILRDEILKQYDIIQNSRYLLYVTVATILTFSLSKSEPLLFLIPYIVIIPTYLISVDYTLDSYRICTYLMVFLEDEDFHWENRQYNFNYIINKGLPKRENFFHVPFILSSLMCSILFYAFVDYPDDFYAITYKFVIKMFIAIIPLLIVILIFIKYKDLGIVQQKYIDVWKKIKISEMYYK